MPPVTVPPVTVAFDIGPTLTPLTGVGVAVTGMYESLAAQSEGPRLLPYVTSWRATPPPGGRRLPLPAALAHRWWARHTHPYMDRWLPEGAQVVHGTNYVVPPSRRPRLVSVYDCWFLRHPDQVHPDVARAAAVLRRSVAQGAVVHTSSHASAEAIRDVLGADVRISVIALGAPATPPAPTSEIAPFPQLNGRPFIVAVGTIERRKNLPRLVGAFANLASANSDVVLVLAGGAGDDSPAVSAAVASLPEPIARRIMVTGRIEQALKMWLLRHAALLAYPSLDEGFGFPLLEAMSLDLPVVGSTAGSIPEVAGDAALLVDPSDTEALADAMTTALCDDEQRRRMITAGRSRVEAFPWSATARGLSDLYAALAMESAGR